MALNNGMRRFPRRTALLAVAALGIGGFFLFMHLFGETSSEQLGRDIIMLASESAPPAAIDELREAGPYATFEALTALMVAMVDKPSREWSFSPQHALKTLIKFHGAESAEAAEAFLSPLKHERPEIRAWALYAISRCCRKRTGAGPATSEILSAIVKTMGDEDARVRDEACDCFVDVHPDWQRGIISCLNHREPLVRCTAIEALGGRGGAEDRVGRFPDAVLPMLDDPDARVCAHAAMSLARLGRGNDRVLSLLRNAITGNDPELRTSACSALGEMGEAATAVIPDLVTCLADENEVTRRCAASSLADIDPATAASSEAACAILIKAVEEGGMPAVFAAQSLGKLGPAAPDSAVSVLECATRSDHAFVKDEAKSALMKIRGMKR